MWPGPTKGDDVSYNEPPSYGAPPPPGGAYGGYGGAGARPEHPQGTTILVLGILGLVCCGLCAIAAWVMGNKAQKEIAAGQYAETSGVKIGRILGMVGTILMILGVVFYLIFFVILAANS
jgi:hypothetical protein